MKNFAAFAACLLLGSLGAAHAQQSSVPRIQTAELGPADKDRSGTVSKQEYQTFMVAAFTEIDVNKDSSLSKNELSQVLTQEQFVAMDASRDGSVDRGEFMNQVMADFANSDTDGDGVLK
ncbi:EF-hand domain-containing protein [Bordetella petrii]|uniref:EF-hand domain-containing protein n=1 Tax=Bordetella petrii TaxID=94624 RepID=UPI001E38C12E|nr:EF-hand domain-containing protein [Bordetella petrii]MCD0503375.1 EF-hand domain-containing protein [Bordetella petrii]